MQTSPLSETGKTKFRNDEDKFRFWVSKKKKIIREPKS